MLIVPAIIAACGSSTGPDSISSHKPSTAGAFPDCLACHSSAQPSFDPVRTNGEGTAGKHVAHVREGGIPCIKCHYQYIDQAAHMNGRMDTLNTAVHLVKFDATNTSGSWVKNPSPLSGICSSLLCHGADAPDWYDTRLVIVTECTACHSYPRGTRRQVLSTETEGDFGKNGTIISHHVAGGNDPTRDQCMVCHDQSNHTSGTVLLRHADGSASIAYNPANPSSLVSFCLSCHDTDGATNTYIGGTAFNPFNDGRVLGSIPNQAGNKIAGYWNSSANIHKSSGGLTCAGTGVPGTGCHGNYGTINMHGSVTKGLLTNAMTFPIPAYSPYNYNDFKLCFDCHDNYPSVSKEVVLGYKEGGHYDVWWAPSPYKSPTVVIRSLFRDRYIASSANYPVYWGGINQPYNDNFFGDSYTPLHNFHLSYTDAWMQNLWNYRGSETGRATCTTCHNVHGTNGTVRSTYAEFGITAFTGIAPDAYKKLVPDSNYEDLVLKAYPIYCNISCHSIVPNTSYWYPPNDE
jgi:predicted CxxxxCH...CXXCH cytochrome family protein